MGDLFIFTIIKPCKPTYTHSQHI